MIPIYDFETIAPEKILNRDIQAEEDVSRAVDEVIAAVRRNGDGALKDYTRRFDGVELAELQVSQAEIDEAWEQVEEDFRVTLQMAADNIRRFHEKQVHQDFVLTDQPGVVMGQRYTPIEKVGICVPRSPVAFPSTILMNVIPAKIAGVSEIVLVTPPEQDGSISPSALAAAKIAGVTKIFKCGGAQAVAALAYGTETVPAVDKIFGPGNTYVAEAKRQVYGMVSIDMIAGPSEILIVADGKTDPVLAAADLLSQAEHDRMAGAVMVTDSPELAEAVSAEIERQIGLLDRREIARASVDANGKIIIAGSIREAVEISNRIAPEHLELCVDDPFDYLDLVRNAGSVFLGRNCPEAVGDYFAGPNHTLPTLGTARFSSPLSVDDFVKKSQYTYLSAEALAGMADKVALFAEKEGLTGHAVSVLSRKRK